MGGSLRFRPCPTAREWLSGICPPCLFPRTNAGPSLLAQLLVGKYQDHLLLHRQIGIFARAGIQLRAMKGSAE